MDDVNIDQTLLVVLWFAYYKVEKIDAFCAYTHISKSSNNIDITIAHTHHKHKPIERENPAEWQSTFFTVLI